MAKILVGRTLDFSTDSVSVEQGAGSVPWSTAEQNVLVPEQFDWMTLAYTGELLTSVSYLQGGEFGTLVATLALIYDGNDNLLSVGRT